MTSHSSIFEGPSIRRTRSAGDPPTTEVRSPTPMSRLSESQTRTTDLTLPSPPHLNPNSNTWLHAPTIPEVAQPVPAVRPAQPLRSRIGRFAAFFGYGRNSSRARKEIAALSWNLSSGLIQVTAIITLLSVAGSTQSPTHPGQNEWRACERPLGIWSIIWVLRVMLSAILAVWGFKRERRIRLLEESAPNPINADGTVSLSAPATVTTLNPTTSSGSRNRTPPSTSTEASALPHSPLFTRLSLLSSLITLTWFLTAHIIEYTSINTCRHSSPHLWWLVFGILCIMYVMVLEVIVVGVIVFIVLPILFVLWNIILIVLGRHPLQNPHQINPEIGSLPKAVVDRIPLVMYIPPPPEDAEKDMLKETSKEGKGPLTTPAPVHLYPPKLPTPSTPTKRRFRFRFIRLKKKGDNSSGRNGGNGLTGERSTPLTWEDHWEQSEYPFVRLEGNRAACAICLLDFEEPKRIGGEDAGDGNGGVDKETGEGGVSGNSGGVQEVEMPTLTVPTLPSSGGTGTGTPVDELRLEDVGEGAQPLRLLACGHVFHKTCLDPWLIDVSGRCPVCQRRVELPEEETKGKKGRRRRGTQRGGEEV